MNRTNITIVLFIIGVIMTSVVFALGMVNIIEQRGMLAKTDSSTQTATVELYLENPSNPTINLNRDPP